MSNNEQSMSITLGASLSENITEPVCDIAEMTLDSFISNETLKEVPMIKYAMTAYHIFDDIRGWNHLRKLKIFIDEFNRGAINNGKLNKYRQKLAENHTFMNKELEYVLVILERYIGLEKPKMLAKLYLAFMGRQITWDEFATYSVVIDRFLPGDYSKLCENGPHITQYNNISDNILRLVALGLMIQTQDSSSVIGDGRGGIMVTAESMTRTITKQQIYDKTEFGQKLVIILQEKSIAKLSASID